MEIDVINQKFIFEAGGLLVYVKGKEPSYLRKPLKRTIIENLEENFKEKSKIVNKNNDVIEIYLKSSNKCNLKCSYCFRKTQEIPFDIEKIEKFILKVINKYECKKVKVDLTGDSEPLMEIEKLQEIIDVCNRIGQANDVEFVYALNSNGTNMSKEILSFLYSNSIVFGFTVEGFSLKQYRRIYGDGIIAQDDVIKNIKEYSLDKNKLFGISMTLTTEHEDLVKEYKNLLKLCNAISMRIVNTFDEIGVLKENLDEWKNKYRNLALYLIEELEKKNYKNFIPILKSRDFFGTYIKAALFDVKRTQACLGGYKQVFLNYTGDVYVCSWGYKDDKYKIGNNLELVDERLNHYEQYTVDTDRKCKSCEVRYVCGGECHIIRGDNEDDELEDWCELKEYLIALSYYIVNWLKINDAEGLEKIKRNINSNIYMGKSEPYIDVLREVFKKNNMQKGANLIKNEIISIEKGPELQVFLEYLRKNEFNVKLIDELDNKFEENIYIKQVLKNDYNYYEIIESKNDLEDETNFNIIKIKNKQ